MFSHITHGFKGKAGKGIDIYQGCAGVAGTGMGGGGIGGCIPPDRGHGNRGDMGHRYRRAHRIADRLTVRIPQKIIQWITATTAPG